MARRSALIPKTALSERKRVRANPMESLTDTPHGKAVIARIRSALKDIPGLKVRDIQVDGMPGYEVAFVETHAPKQSQYEIHAKIQQALGLSDDDISLENVWEDGGLDFSIDSSLLHNPRRTATPRSNPASYEEYMATYIMPSVRRRAPARRPAARRNPASATIASVNAALRALGFKPSHVALKRSRYGLVAEGADTAHREGGAIDFTGFSLGDFPVNEWVVRIIEGIDESDNFDPDYETLDRVEHARKMLRGSKSNPRPSRRPAARRRRNGLSEDGMIVQSNPRATGPFRTMAEIRAANEALGHNFFDRGNMKFFASKVEGGPYGGRYFITSEKTGFESTKREYRLRRVADDGRITSVGEPFKFKEDAIDAARAAARTVLANPSRRRNPQDVFGRGSANIPANARFGTGIAGPIIIGGPPVLAPVPDRPIIISSPDIGGGKSGGGGGGGGGTTTSTGPSAPSGGSTPAARANPRRNPRKSARSRAAQSDAKRAMDLFHSGKADSLAAAWRIVKRGR